MSDPRLDVFSPTLLRLILCGGDGLAPAYGPTVESRRFVTPRPGAWCGDRMVAIEGRHGASGVDRLDDLDPAAWSLPLDHWAPRLALVAAHRLRAAMRDDLAPLPRSAWVIADADWVALHWHSETVHGGYVSTWRTSGRPINPANRALPTLPHLLTDHAPVVALLLAIEEVSRA